MTPHRTEAPKIPTGKRAQYYLGLRDGAIFLAGLLPGMPVSLPLAKLFAAINAADLTNVGGSPCEEEKLADF